MTDVPDRPAEDPATAAAPDPDRAEQFARLRSLLLGREQREIAELRDELEARDLSADELAEHLPEAIALRAGRDDRLARALSPTIETAFSESVRRNPQEIAEAIYPALGPAIRKAIAEAISGLVTTINRSLESSLSVRGIKWRLEAWRSGVPYGQIVMKHALVYRVEQAYLIDGQTGLLLAHVTAPDLSAPDADVISGMLTAIRDFVSDSFEPRGEGGLKEFVVDDLTVLVEAGPKARLAAVVRGEHPPALLERLQEVLELIHLRFAGPLADFDGDTAPFEPATPVLATCLETVVETARPRRRGLAPRLTWAAVGIVLLVLLSTFVLRERRARRALRALAAEPGLVVLDTDRGLRSWHLRGLRDPLAASPNAVLAAHGIDTARVVGSWTPYLSVEPAMLQARAARALGAPATITLTLAGDTLLVAGTASTDWLDVTRRRWPTIPGLGALSDTAVAPRLPARLEAVAASLEAERVLFAAGSATLPPGADRILADVASRWQTVRDGVGPDWDVILEIVGRTDATGSQEVNRTLSDERADRARAVLERLGLPRTALAARGVGTSDPLAADGDERARRNRSVSFSVGVRAAAPGAEIAR